jgi:hypothetical protein
MGGLDRISPKKVGVETKLGEMTGGESFALQHPLAVMMYNYKRQKEGLPPIRLEPIHTDEIREKEGMDEREKEAIALRKEERRLQHEAFNEWVDENGAEKLSERFREYIKRHPDQKLDLNNPVDVGTLFEFMFPPKSVEQPNADAKLVFEQDLI